jgi:hypothetical protein
MIKSRIETSAGLTELSDTELDLVAGGAFHRPAPPPGGGATVPPPLGGGLASLGGDFSKLFTDLKDGAFSTIRADYTAILHDAGVGGA